MIFHYLFMVRIVEFGASCVSVILTPNYKEAIVANVGKIVIHMSSLTLSSSHPLTLFVAFLSFLHLNNYDIHTLYEFFVRFCR
jgi:hypothetical protein